MNSLKNTIGNFIFASLLIAGLLFIGKASTVHLLLSIEEMFFISMLMSASIITIKGLLKAIFKKPDYSKTSANKKIIEQMNTIILLKKQVAREKTISSGMNHLWAQSIEKSSKLKYQIRSLHEALLDEKKKYRRLENRYNQILQSYHSSSVPLEDSFNFDNRKKEFLTEL